MLYTKEERDRKKFTKTIEIMYFFFTLILANNFFGYILLLSRVSIQMVKVWEKYEEEALEEDYFNKLC